LVSFPFNIHFHNYSYYIYFLSPQHMPKLSLFSLILSTIDQYYFSHICFLLYLLL
jgi:hypothetical protein